MIILTFIKNLRKIKIMDIKIHQKIKSLIFRKKAPSKILVREVMSKRVLKIDRDWDLWKVYLFFKRNRISGAPVFFGKKLVGEISRSDLLEVAEKEFFEELEEAKDILKRKKVFEVMKKPIVIKENKSLEEARILMKRKNISRLLVVDKNGELVGILTKTDLAVVMGKERILEETNKKINEFLKLVEKEGEVWSDEVKKRIGISREIIEEWAKKFEEVGLIELEYTKTGKVLIRKLVEKI